MRLPPSPVADLLRRSYGCRPDAQVLDSWATSLLDGPHDNCFGIAAVRRAVSRLRLGVRVDATLPYDGELRILAGGRNVIFVRSAQGPSRRAFTLAHEVGHASLHALAPDLDQAGAATERICDLFAAELLMPARLVHALVADRSLADTVLSLATLTGTSLPAACIRVSQTFSVPVGILDQDGRPSGEFLPGIGASAPDPRCLVPLTRAGDTARERRIAPGWYADVAKAGRRIVYVLHRGD